MQFAQGAILGDMLNKLFGILWPYCDKYGEFIVNVLNMITPISA